MQKKERKKEKYVSFQIVADNLLTKVQCHFVQMDGTLRRGNDQTISNNSIQRIGRGKIINDSLTVPKSSDLQFMLN